MGGQAYGGRFSGWRPLRTPWDQEKSWKSMEGEWGKVIILKFNIHYLQLGRVRFNFSKVIRGFANENKSKTDIECRPSCLGQEKNFNARWPKTALNSISFTSLNYWITSDLHQDLFENKLRGILHTYIHKRIISAFIKILQIKLLP